MLKRNLIANFIGQGWMALMSLAFIPLYIKYLGIESYALIGVFAILHAALMVLDMGMTPALSREIARFNGSISNAQSIRDLLRSMEVLGLCITILVASCVWAASGLLATDWLKAEKLPTGVVEKAIVIMGFVVALRFIENIYQNCLVGLQKQVTSNVINCTVATLRGLGAVGVLAWVSPSIEAFFVWQGIVSLLTIIILIIAVYQYLPALPQGGRFSWESLKNIRHFALGIMIITILSFLLMQVDKILLSRLLTLEHFGYYTLAALAANSLNIFAAPIDQAFFPRFSALVARDDQLLLKSTYHMGAQLVTVLVGSAAIVLMIFGDVVLTLWTHNIELTQKVTPLLIILSIGMLLNCLMHMPYQLQLAHGWTSLTIKVNAIAVILAMPAIFLVAPRYGAAGAAWVWVVLNASYVFFVIHIIFRRLLTTEKWRWYIQDVAVPLLAAVITAGIAKWSIPDGLGTVGQTVTLLLSSSLTLTVTALTAPLVRQQLYLYVTKMAKPYCVKKP